MVKEDQPPIYILVRGLLGAYMPGHFQKVLIDLRKHGAECLIAPTHPAGEIGDNATRIAEGLANQVNARRRLIFLAHSKGGIETFAALNLNRRLRDQTKSVVLVQTPKRGAPYLKSLFNKNLTKNSSQALKERFHKLTLTAVFAGKACRELATDNPLPYVEQIENSRFDFPVFSYSTFSTQNSGWIELQSNRIAELEPGRRNDGVFLTDDQVWPQFRHREIPEVDHAEPTVGSKRIDEALFWRQILMENKLF